MKTVYYAATQNAENKPAEPNEKKIEIPRRFPQIRIESVDLPYWVIFSSDLISAHYEVGMRLFPMGLEYGPPTSKVSITVTALEKAIDSIREMLRKDKEKAPDVTKDITSGVVEIPGFKGMDQTTRMMVILTASIIAWLRDKEIPEPEDGIVLLSGEPKTLQVVRGDERPELCFIRVNAETGAPELCKYRFYTEEDVKIAGDLSMADGAPVSITKTVTDPATGESKSVPVFGQEAIATRLFVELMQEGRRIRENWDGGIRAEQEGEAETLGVDAETAATIRLFVSAGDLLKLPEIPFPPKKLPEACRGNTLLELTDAAFIAVVKVDREKRNTWMTLFRRIAVAAFSTALSRLHHVRVGDRDYLTEGNLELQGDEESCLTALAIAKGYKKLAGLLLAADCMDRIRQDKTSGIQIALNGENIEIRRINGTERPALACYAANNFSMFRGYGEEEDGTSEILAVLTPESIEQAVQKLNGGQADDFSQSEDITLLTAEAEKGNAAAMKRLGKLYEAGELVPQDNAKAAELYRKALELTPDDKDLEFDLFMLEMIL